MSEKIKVVWICHFSNAEVFDKIKPRKPVKEKAPWIKLSYDILKDNKDIDLYIISPYEYINGIKYFEINSIKFFFYNAHMPLIGRHWPDFFKFDYLTNFKKNKRITKKIIKKINPDIIHLHGAENAYYSSTILQFIDKYPTILTPQGFISSSRNVKLMKTRKRIKIEKEIFSQMNNIIYRTKNMIYEIKSLNPKANLYYNNYPMKKIKDYSINTKEFDVVFFARITREKGIYDLIKAISIVKNNGNRNISLCVIGGINIELEKLSKDLDVESNIFFKGFLPTQEDVHELVSKARISVLPTYNDVISGTIIESLFLKVPVVAYNVGSISEVNKNQVIISLVEKHDISGLADSIEELLSNPSLIKERANKGYARVNEMFNESEEEISKGLINAYRKSILSFNN